MRIYRGIPVFAIWFSALVAFPAPASPGVSRPVPLNTRCFVDPRTGVLIAKRLAARSAAFRKAAEEAWRATHNGDAPFEAGFSIDNEGNPGKVQLSLFETSSAATHLNLASSPTALGTLHVHNRFGKSTPSPADIQAARAWRQTIYVESRAGLYSINPDGKVCYLFREADWFRKHCSPANTLHASSKAVSSPGPNHARDIP